MVRLQRQLTTQASPISSFASASHTHCFNNFATRSFATKNDKKDGAATSSPKFKKANFLQAAKPTTEEGQQVSQPVQETQSEPKKKAPKNEPTEPKVKAAKKSKAKSSEGSNNKVKGVQGRAQLDQQLADKLLSDKLVNNLYKVNDAQEWNLSEAQALIEMPSNLMRRAKSNEIKISDKNQKLQHDFIQKQALMLWPQEMTPQAVKDFKQLTDMAQIPMHKDQLEKLNPAKKNEILKARDQLSLRRQIRDKSLADEGNMQALQSKIKRMIKQQDDKAKDVNMWGEKKNSFWWYWTGEDKRINYNEYATLATQGQGFEEEQEQSKQLAKDIDEVLMRQHQIEKLNPYLLKTEEHMTAEERKQADSINRKNNLRLEQIKSRCNFHEIYRNKNMFVGYQFRTLIRMSLAKTSESEIPAEFKTYATFLKTYEKENPGKFYIAKQFGQHIKGTQPKSRDLMSYKDYVEAFGEGGQPEELEKAMTKYSERIVKQYVDENQKVNKLMDYLTESKEPVNKAEIDEIVSQIKEMEDQQKRVHNSAVVMEDNQSGITRWATQKHSNDISQANNLIAENQQHMVGKKVTQLSSDQFQEYHEQAKAYLSGQDASFDQLCNKLNLDKSQAFAAFITDVFVNTSVKSQQGVTSCLLLDRFVSLLGQLSGNQASVDASVEELCQTFEGDNSEFDRQHVYYNLARDPKFMLKFTALQIAKQHNLYGQVDNYMRSFAKICVGVQDGGDIAKRLEGVLNTEVAICDSSKGQAFNPKDYTQMLDHQTVDPMVIAQPDFPFLPAGMKIARIEEYNRMKSELRKTRDVREMLQGADKSGSQTQRRLMNSPSQFNSILDHLDADPMTGGEHGKVGDMWFFERMKKISGSVDGLVQKIVGQDFGHAEIGWNNIEQIFNPHVSGVCSIDAQKQRLISAGMSVNLAEELSQQYLSKMNQQSSVHTIMDFFSNDRSKRALHDQSVDMKSICMNYEGVRRATSRVNSIKSGLKSHALASLGRITPVRPIGMGAARQFSTVQTETDSSESEKEEEEQKEKTGRFFKFLQSAEKLDDKITENPAEAKKVSTGNEEEELEDMFDASELDISLSSSIVDTMIEEDMIEPIKTFEPVQKTVRQIDAKQFALITKAKKKYNFKFFEKHAYEGPMANRQAQLSLEQLFETLAPSDKELLVLSMLNSTYELNDIIPNIELLFYKMFISPISTKRQRKNGDGDELLAGNLFHEQDMNMPEQAYKSLLQSVALQPKKKHFKKILQYVVLNEKPENVSSDLIDLITYVGIDQKYPILLGSTMKYLLQNDYKIKENTFQRFVMFLERCKGFEEDAKRFLFLSQETDEIQINYKMVRPLFQRAMQFKTPQDVLQLFEQFRKNLKLNRSSEKWDPKTKQVKLNTLKKEFYDGLINDLITKKAYQLAQIIFGEKKREKFTVTINDQFIGLEIFSSQKKIDEYRTIFAELSHNDSTYTLDQGLCEEIGRTLLKFSSEEHQNAMLDMCDSLQFRMFENNIPVSSKLFDSFVTQYTETQSWTKIVSLLSSCNYQNCDPNFRILSYLKKNMVYCFDTNIRQQLKEGIDSFENRFFSNEGREHRRQLQVNQATRAQLQQKKIEDAAEPLINASAEAETTTTQAAATM